MAGEAVGEPMQDVADHRPGRRGDHADDARQIRQRQLAVGVEQALGGERAFALLEQRHERADACRLEIVDDDLIFRFVGIGGDASLDHHFEPLLGLELEPLIRALPDHRLDRGLLVLQHEIAMAGGVLAPEAGDLAAQPHQAVGLLDRALQREGELRDAIFDEVRRDFRCAAVGYRHSGSILLAAASVLGRQPLSQELYPIERAVDRWRRPRACARLEAQAKPPPRHALLRAGQCRDRAVRRVPVARCKRSRRGGKGLQGETRSAS